MNNVFNFNFNFNFKDLFNSSKNDELDLFLETIKKQNNKETIISEILLKITNGVYNCLLFYKYNNDGLILEKEIGNFNFTEVSYNYYTSIPIYIDKKLSFSVVLLSDKNKKLSKKSLKLIGILKDYLE